jgi:phospholipid/cholesterol/gamma-HCH transport system substrate-binding protein
MGTREKRSELAMGLFLFLGLAVLGGLVMQFGRLGDRFRDKYRISVVFKDASGLIKGSDVRMGGAKIGRVAELPELTPDLKVRVEMLIDNRVQIPKGSKFQVTSATLLGDKLVVVVPPKESDGTVIEPGSMVVGAGPSGLEALQSDADEFRNDAREIIGQAKKALNSLDLALSDIRGFTAGLREMSDKLNTKLFNDENIARLNRTLENLDETLAETKEAGKRVAPVLDDAREAIGSMKEAAESTKATLAKVDEKLDQLDPVFKEVPKAVASISRAADKTADALESAEKGDGLLGTLAYDREVSTDTKAFITNLRHYGILRYRDAENPDKPDPRNRFRGHRR